MTSTLPFLESLSEISQHLVLRSVEIIVEVFPRPFRSSHALLLFAPAEVLLSSYVLLNQALVYNSTPSVHYLAILGELAKFQAFHR